MTRPVSYHAYPDRNDLERLPRELRFYPSTTTDPKVLTRDQIEQYNRYYLFEKECRLGSTRLAARFYAEKPLLTRESLRDDYPPLPVPELRG